MADRAWNNVMIAVGRGALAKHQRSCAVCTDDYACEVADMHLRTIERLQSENSSSPGSTQDGA